MAKNIYYNDNLYFISEMITNIHNGIKLDIDSDLFLDKLLDTLFFIDETLKKIYASLVDNERLLKRRQYLKTLLRTENYFTVFLGEVINKQEGISREIQPFTGRIREVHFEHKTMSDNLHNLLRQIIPSDSEGSDMVSEEEFNLLFMPEEDPGISPTDG